MIINVDNYDLCLTYSWGYKPQGMTGHLFECIEYFYILKNHFKCCIFIGEELPKEFIKQSINNKYMFTEDEVNEILDSIIFFNNPAILKGNNVLITDGNFNKLDKKFLFFKKIMAFPCADMKFKEKENIIVFQDDRIYGKTKAKTFNYIKKILLTKYKNINGSKNYNLIYATKNARGLSEEYYSDLENQYSGDFLLLTNTEIKSKLSNRYVLEEMPVENLFEKFKTYIYMPVGKKFDCSPRFLVECKYYNKDVILHNIDYLDVDLGLKWRLYDIEHNYEKLFLKEDDEIINLIKGII